jgi:DNA-binding XRE family transcriptional regulator
MIYAYERDILDYVAGNVGSMLQTATRVYHYPAHDFLYQFCSSKVARGVEDASPKYLVGMSGVELFWQVIHEKEGREANSCPWAPLGYTLDYWIGWTLARYQWHSGRPFHQILAAISYDDFAALYPTLHEAPDEKSYEVLDGWFARRPSPVLTLRKQRGLTQLELAQRSGVATSTLRALEQNKTDPHCARYSTLHSLAQVLRVNIEDLL